MRIVGVRVEVEGPVPPPGEVGAMIAANHVSWLDIFVLSSVRPTRFIAKSEIREWPVAGWIAEGGGTIFISRERRRDTARIGDAVREAMRAGDCVGLFPEGTTTEGDTLLKFHSSLFEPAVANEAHVHPCALRYRDEEGGLCRAVTYAGDRTFMQSFGLVMRQRGVVVSVTFAPVVETRGRTRREVAAMTEAAVATLLGLPPDRASRTGADPPAAPR